MGRPYLAALADLPSAFSWLAERDEADLSRHIGHTARLPLVAVASGGSHSAARFCAYLHHEVSGRVARAMTPLEITSIGGIGGDVVVALFSASGNNPDILSALTACAFRSPRAGWVMTGQLDTPLANQAAALSTFRVVEGLMPPGSKDSYLATVSLLAFCVTAYKTYQKAFGGLAPLPTRWQELADLTPMLRGAAPEALWDAPMLVVLHGASTGPAAVDLESRWAESGLGPIQITDFRSFAHGRHQTLVQYPEAAILSLVAPEDAALADGTLNLIPRRFIRSRLLIPHGGAVGSIRAIIDVMRLTASAAAHHGLEPGSPTVPTFGRRLYASKVILARTFVPTAAVAPPGYHAIERKTRRPYASLPESDRDYWLTALETAITTLESTTFHGVVVDYDGTLFDPGADGTVPRRSIVKHLAGLLSAGVPVGVATGRGKSVRAALRAALPAHLHRRLHVGYYNCTAIARLSDDSSPDISGAMHDALRPIHAAIAEDLRLRELAHVTSRPTQITLEVRAPYSPDDLWDHASGVVYRTQTPAQCVRSSHSIDILPAVATKCDLVERLATDGPILRIGDRGLYPGNDSAMLATLHGLSVDEVSGDPRAAWHLGRAGDSGPQLTVRYFGAMSVLTGGRLCLPRLRTLAYDTTTRPRSSSSARRRST